MKQIILRLLGWTALLDIPSFFAGILILLTFNAYVSLNPEEPYFDLFLIFILYQDDEEIYSVKENPSSDEKLNIKWIVNEDDLRSFKDPKMKIINRGGAFYALTRDEKNNFWIHANYITYRGNQIDTTWDGMGCGTGMYNQPIAAGEVIEYLWFNSLFEKINTPYYRDREEPTTTDLAIDELFGDSTEIYWTLSTFSVPWSAYTPQVVKSPSFMLYPDELKNTWLEQASNRKISPMFHDSLKQE